MKDGRLLRVALALFVMAGASILLWYNMQPRQVWVRTQMNVLAQLVRLNKRDAAASKAFRDRKIDSASWRVRSGAVAQEYEHMATRIAATPASPEYARVKRLLLTVATEESLAERGVANHQPVAAYKQHADASLTALRQVPQALSRVPDQAPTPTWWYAPWLIWSAAFARLAWQASWHSPSRRVGFLLTAVVLGASATLLFLFGTWLLWRLDAYVVATSVSRIRLADCVSVLAGLLGAFGLLGAARPVGALTRGSS